MTALLIVDLQNDFLPGGSLPVEEGDRIIPVINTLMEKDFDLIVASKDWHPYSHGSFADTHGKEVGEHIELGGVDQHLWPVHCVQGTDGAEFPDGLNVSGIEEIVFKGTDQEIDSYSAFFDNAYKKDTGLERLLANSGIKKVYVGGLATDYCVKFTVMDALKLGFETYLVKDACRGIDVQEGDIERAIDEMKRAGAHIVNASDIVL